jgi:hypothetical protein
MTPAVETAIRELAARGMSRREIGRRVGLSHTSVAKVLAKSAPSSGTPSPGTPHETLLAGLRATPAPGMPAPAAPAIDADAPALEQGRTLIRELRADLERARAISDSQSVQRLSRTIALSLPMVARLESLEAEEKGGVYITKAEIDDARDFVRSRLAAQAERGPLRCSKCSRELSIEWGTAAPPAKESDAPEADAP